MCTGLTSTMAGVRDTITQDVWTSPRVPLGSTGMVRRSGRRGCAGSVAIVPVLGSTPPGHVASSTTRCVLAYGAAGTRHAIQLLSPSSTAIMWGTGAILAVACAPTGTTATASSAWSVRKGGRATGVARWRAWASVQRRLYHTVIR